VVNRVERAVPYGLGQVMDVYRPGRPEPGPAPAAAGASVVLLWHGVGPDERDVLGGLAAAAARLGVLVCVPDWRPDAPERGRAQLLASLGFARENAAGYGGDPSRIVLAGWSLGGRSAAGVAVTPEAVDGWRPSAVVCLAAGFSTAPAPATGAAPLECLARGDVSPVPFWLVHGTRDEVVGITQSRNFAAALRRRGWPARLDEPVTDHAGVVMAEYDPAIRRCRPATAGQALSAGRLSACILAAAAGAVAPPAHAGGPGGVDGGTPASPPAVSPRQPG
jgi:acetyl esterase/lipase